MTISPNLIGNLLGRHLKHDVGDQNYNATTGRGYVFSGDGRVGFFVDFSQSDTVGPRYAVSFSAAMSSTDAGIRKAEADKFVASTATAPFTFPTTFTNASVFYKAFDTNVIDFDSSSISSVLAQQGLGRADFSNTAMLLETWIDGIIANADTADVSANSGIRGFIAGVTGHRAFKLWSEMTATPVNATSPTWTAPSKTVMNDFGENLMLTDPSQLSLSQRYMLIDGQGGFDYLGLYFTQTSGISANFSNTELQTITYNNATFKVKNFEGMDLTDFDDTFTGSAFDNTVYASKGTDTIDGGGKWNKSADGKTDGTSTDRDWVQYINGTASITVNTSSAGVMKVKDYGGSVDTLTNVEAIGGTYYIDRMYGGTGNFNQIFAGNKGGDVIDGGAGRDDRVWHGDDPSGVVVNLSAQTVNTQAVTQFANSIKYAGAESIGALLAMKEVLENLDMPMVKSVASNRALDGWGDVDVLSNMEAAQGSSFNDQLYGSNDRNILSGGDGFDFIVGNGGNDYITGGMGHDALYGGLGRDWIVMDELNWGKLTPATTVGVSVPRSVRDLDQSGNLVVYKSVNESTTSNADVLDGFVLGKDIIDLTAMDANTKRSGNQEFSDTLVEVWTKKAGQLKISTFTGLTDDHNFAVSSATNGYKLSGVLLEGDVNGDAVADFAIRLVGMTLSEAKSPVNGLSDSILY
ncbi:calcium-binding protein [Limnohabitans sp.]|nr:M10 family metallopeptidase C-terminal domain-containing protein [Comamonadaceae bacterium]